MPLQLIYDPTYLKHDTGFHPENARRLAAILRAIESDASLSRKLERVLPEPARNEDIARCHRDDLSIGTSITVTAPRKSSGRIQLFSIFQRISIRIIPVPVRPLSEEAAKEKALH